MTYPSLCVFPFFLPSPTHPPCLSILSSFPPFIHLFTQSLINWFVHLFINFLPSFQFLPLPPSLSSLLPHPSPSLPLLFFSLWHVFTIFVPVFENQTLLQVVNFFVLIIVIFQSIVSGFLIDFPQDVRNCADAIVGARFVSLVRSPLTTVLLVSKKFAFYEVKQLLAFCICCKTR